MDLSTRAALLIALAVGLCGTVLAEPPARTLNTAFLMTLRAPLEPASNINDSLSIANVPATGGWVQGPRIRGVLVPPGGDWSRTLVSGVLRLDVRLTIKTDDGALIYVSYNGIEKDSAMTAEKSKRGEVLGGHDVKYWVIAPTFETSAPQYAWLNELQAVGRMSEYKDGPGGFVKYEIYAADSPVADDSAADQKAVAALDTQYQLAVKNNDAETMGKILADNFVVVEGSGHVWTKADLLESARNGGTHYERQDDTDRSVRVWGDTAVVTARLWAKGIEDGKAVEYSEWFSDTYVRTGAGWRYVFGQASLPLH